MSLWLLLFCFSVVAPAQGAEYVLRIDRDEACPIGPPTPKIEKGLRALLGYKHSDAIVGFVLDLNGDRINDYIIQANKPLCGAETCPYEIMDGSSNKSIGTVIGDPLVVSSMKIQGHLVIQAYGHGGAKPGMYGTYVFDEGQYVEVSGIDLISE
ncbi:MAG: hypothetical protein IPP35_10595 [Elusimicrobia bacterium]|nr:hypothetical protein [Elusimicrobiota bacterium]